MLLIITNNLEMWDSMNNKDIFISYKAEEFDEANWVRMILEKNGISCWMAPMCIPGGSSYANEIPQAIKNCKVFVLILSQKSQSSKWVPRELDQAINDEKIIMPFMIENCSLKDEFNFYLTNVQRYYAYENKAKAMEKMISEIKSILNVTEKSSDPPADCKTQTETAKENTKKESPIKSEDKQKTFEDDGPKKKKSKLPILFCCIPVMLIIIGVIVYFVGSRSVNIAGKDISLRSMMLVLEDTTLTQNDIELIGKLEKLSDIYFTNCKFPNDDVSVIFKPEYTTISLINCGIGDKQLESIDFSSLTELSYLDLSENKDITSLDMISDLPANVRKLDFYNTSITDLNFVSGFTALYELDISKTEVQDITPLQNCTALQTLYLDNINISSLKPLSNCTKLGILSVNDNNLETLEGLETCINLICLYANNNKLADIDALSNATVLQQVELRNNNLSDISVLSKSAETLVDIIISNNNISDISCFEQADMIRNLNIDNNKTTSLECLNNCDELCNLSAKSNQITSIKGIENCKNLNYFNLSDNKIASIEGFPAIESDNSGITVDLSNNQIHNLDLPSGYRFSYLSLSGNDNIESLANLSSSEGIELIVDYNKKIDFSDIADGKYTKVYILNCPLDKQVSLTELLGDYIVNFATEDDVENLIDSHIPSRIAEH